MLRIPGLPDLGAPAQGGDKALAVKDTLREVRFSVKNRARRIVDAVESAAQLGRPGDDIARGPLGLLGEPFRLAVRTTATLLQNVDHAAIDLLTADGPYRSMTVPLVPSATWFESARRGDSAHGFATDHLWRYRHWLTLKRRADVFVHEQAIARAGAEIADVVGAPAEVRSDHDPAAELHRRTTVPVVLALQERAVLSMPAADGPDAELAALGALGAVVVVLAGEIAPRLAGLDVRERYAHALQLADEIAVADRGGWEGALRSLVPAEALGRWFAFVARHV